MGKSKYITKVSAGQHIDHRTPAQRTMQADMEAAKAAEVIDEAIGSKLSTDPQVLEVALKVIDDTRLVGMQFTMTQWGYIQMLVERGVIAGRNHLVDEMDGDAGNVQKW
jgi:hypothetical protein